MTDSGDPAALLARLLQAAHDGAQVDLQRRSLDPAILRQVCLSKDVDPRGVRVANAIIMGPLDLDGASLPFALVLQQCEFRGAVQVRNATLASLDLSESTLKGGLCARHLRVHGDVFLRRAQVGAPHSSAAVDLDHASVEGDVTLLGAHLGVGGEASPAEKDLRPCLASLSAERAQVDGTIVLKDGFEAEGPVMLAGASVGGQVNCAGGRFLDSGEYCLWAQGIKVELDVLFRQGFRAHGAVSLAGATVKGELDCGGGWFETDLDAMAATIEGKAVIGQWTQVGESPTPCAVKGMLWLLDAQFKRDLRIKKVTVGRLVMWGARVETDLELNELTVTEQAPGLYYFGHTPTAIYPLDLENASVGTICDLFGPPRLTQPLQEHETVKEGERRQAKERGKLYRLAGLNCDAIHPVMQHDAEVLADWIRYADQKPGQAAGPGRHIPQVYDTFVRLLQDQGRDDDAVELAIRERADARWAGAQEARSPGTAILQGIQGMWDWVLQATISYGYRPWRALVGLLIFWVLGGAGYGVAWKAGVIVPSSDALLTVEAGHSSPGEAATPGARAGLRDRLRPEYPPFHPWMYALDRLLPVVGLSYVRNWMPDQSQPWGRGLVVMDWCLTGIGWVLSLLFAGAVSGIIRKT